MPSCTSQQEEPDEDREVIVELIRVLDVFSGEQPYRWSVFVGNERQGSFGTKAEAENSARHLARTLSVRAWLLDQAGYPLKHIDLG